MKAKKLYIVQCHHLGCVKFARRDSASDKGWFIKMNYALCPEHHPDRDSDR